MRTSLVLIVGALALITAACGGSSSKSASSTSTTKASSSPSTTEDLRSALSSVGAAAPSSFTLSLAKGPQGIYETGPNGHTLYYFTKDTGTTSACTGACATT